MKTKVYWVAPILILLIVVLMFSIAATANANKEIKIFKSSKSFIDKDIEMFANKYKRVITEDIDEGDIKLLKNEGCLIKHRLKHSASFECPEEIISKLKVREARIFRILDLEADQQINADDVWAEGINGEGVNVVILDTGIDSSHIELSDNIKGQKDFVNNDDIAEDDNGHGTHVAGIITANGVYQIDGNYATGVSPAAGIYILKVCDASGLCYEDDMIAAMEYAIGLDAKIMSISIGGGNFGSHCDSDPLAAKVNWVVDNGFTVVVAAGNEGRGVSSPACASKAIAVGAVDKNGIVPYWSNRGAALDIVAPGVDILSTYSCLAAGDCSYYWYAYMSGTSMSAPHVSGVVALLLKIKPTATLDEIKNALYSTASPPNKCYKCTRWSKTGSCSRQSVVTCTSDIIGAGVVNAYGAYLAIKPTVCEPTTETCDGVDNDCDGLVDEDITRQCGVTDVGACTFGTETCSAGKWIGCDAVFSTTEACNNIDDDCDRITDENLTVYSGTDIGECQQGITECIDGSMVETQLEIDPTLEICDNLDNDCDRIVDQIIQQCGTTDIGACTFGTETCTLGVWEDCVGEVGPTTEVCNGIDDDCDGGLPLDEADADADGYIICKSDCDDTNTAINPGATEICDGIDNNCNGEIDEGGVCGIQPVKCWSAEYQYLYKNRDQAKKFCKCAQGTYRYSSYSYTLRQNIVYKYLDSKNNENWKVTSMSSYLPVYKVRCTDRNWYNTNQDYYYSG